MSASMKAHRLYPSLLLGAITLLSAAAVTVGNSLTEQPIAARRAEDLANSLGQVLPAALHDNALATDTRTIDGKRVYVARRQGKVTAVAFESSAPGYSGDIVLLMALDRDGVILGVRVLRHTETPGLGDKIEAKKSSWIDGFRQRSLGNPEPQGWQVKKDGGVFDQFTGATITPRAVVKAVHEGLQFFAMHRKELLNETMTVAETRHEH